MIAGPNGIPMVISQLQELPIPRSKIEDYADRAGVRGSAHDHLIHIVTAMDDEYRTVLADKRAGITQSDEGEES